MVVYKTKGRWRIVSSSYRSVYFSMLQYDDPFNTSTSRSISRIIDFIGKAFIEESAHKTERNSCETKATMGRLVCTGIDSRHRNGRRGIGSFLKEHPARDLDFLKRFWYGR